MKTKYLTKRRKQMEAGKQQQQQLDVML